MSCEGGDGHGADDVSGALLGYLEALQALCAAGVGAGRALRMRVEKESDLETVDQYIEVSETVQNATSDVCNDVKAKLSDKQEPCDLLTSLVQLQNQFHLSALESLAGLGSDDTGTSGPGDSERPAVTGESDHKPTETNNQPVGKMNPSVKVLVTSACEDANDVTQTLLSDKTTARSGGCISDNLPTDEQIDQIIGLLSGDSRTVQPKPDVTLSPQAAVPRPVLSRAPGSHLLNQYNPASHGGNVYDNERPNLFPGQVYKQNAVPEHTADRRNRTWPTRPADPRAAASGRPDLTSSASDEPQFLPANSLRNTMTYCPDPEFSQYVDKVRKTVSKQAAIGSTSRSDLRGSTTHTRSTSRKLMNSLFPTSGSGESARSPWSTLGSSSSEDSSGSSEPQFLMGLDLASHVTGGAAEGRPRRRHSSGEEQLETGSAASQTSQAGQRTFGAWPGVSTWSQSRTSTDSEQSSVDLPLENYGAHSASAYELTHPPLIGQWSEPLSYKPWSQPGVGTFPFAQSDVTSATGRQRRGHLPYKYPTVS